MSTLKNRDCEHCANHTPDGCSSWECEFRARGEDLISRQDAIEALVKRHFELIKRKCYDLANGTGESIEVIKALPSAEKTGKWKLHSSKGAWVCSYCKERELRTTDFCPNCGARMVKE